MKFTNRQIDYLCEAYLHAVDQLQFCQLVQLWELAARDEALEQAFHEMNDAILEEEKEMDFSRMNRFRPT
jgi:type I restriction-modification system DNA methylase subunit